MKKEKYDFWSILFFRPLSVYWWWEEDCSNESNGFYKEGDDDVKELWTNREYNCLSWKQAKEVQDCSTFCVIVPWFIAWLLLKIKEFIKVK